MGVYKGRLAGHEFDVVECEVFQNALTLHVDDFTLVMHEIVDSEILLEGIIDTVEAALLEAGKVQSGFTKSLAGNRAGIDAASAHVLGALDDGNAFAKIGGLGAALFTGRAAADHDQTETVTRTHEFLREYLTTNLPRVAQLNPEDCTGYVASDEFQNGTAAPHPLFFGSADSKGVAGAKLVSADSRGLNVAAFSVIWEWLVSADSGYGGIVQTYKAIIAY